MTTRMELVRPGRQERQSEPGSIAGSLSRVIDQIGRPQFVNELGTYLNQLCGADYVHEFHFVDGVPHPIASIGLDGKDFAEHQSKTYFESKCYRCDPSMEASSSIPGHAPVLLHFDPNEADAGELRAFFCNMLIRERLLVCGKSAEGIVGLSLLRSDRNGPFSRDDRDRLDLILDVLFSIVAKHCDLHWQRQKSSVALTSLPAIEAVFMHATPRIPRREAQVGARILWGLSTTGIALDLNIGTETVISYRKRLYERMSVSCSRELTLWFLKRNTEVGEYFGEDIAAPRWQS